MSFQMGDTPKAVIASGVKNTEAAGEAALSVLGSVLEEVARDPNMDPEARRNSVEHMQNLGMLTADGTVAPPQALLRETVVTPLQANEAGVAASAVLNGLVPQPAEAQVVPQQQEAAQIEEPLIPDDVAAWLEEPDDEPEEPAPAAEYEDPEDDSYVDPQVAEERRKRVAAEKRAEHSEGLRVRAERPKWEAEVKAARYVISPLQVAAIEATSRRGFWRAAKAIHEQNSAVLAELGVPDPATVRQEVTAQVAEQAAEQARVAWGTPMVSGPQGAAPATIAAQQHQDRLTRARQGSSFVEVVKAAMGL